MREHRFDLLYDKLLAPGIAVVMLALWTAHEWFRFFYPAPPQPLVASLFLAGFIGYAGWQYRRTWPKIRTLKQAEDGEKAVGQLLEALRGQGYAVFHDLVDDDFNVDHVIIGPAGAFTIETKTWSKPAKGSSKISFDGATLRAAGWEPDRDPVVQAKAQSSWLQRLLGEITDKAVPVRPVIVFPGWFVEDSRASRKDLWVLEPKALSAFLANEPAVLAPEDVKLASLQLSRFIRGRERELARQ